MSTEPARALSPADLGLLLACLVAHGCGTPTVVDDDHGACVESNEDVLVIDSSANQRYAPRLAGSLDQFGLLYMREPRVPVLATMPRQSGDGTRTVLDCFQGSCFVGGSDLDSVHAVGDGFVPVTRFSGTTSGIQWLASPEGPVRYYESQTSNRSVAGAEVRDQIITATAYDIDEDPYGHPHLAIARATLSGTTPAEHALDGWTQSFGARDPQAIRDGDRVWVAYRTNIDFPYTVFIDEIDVSNGHVIREHWGPSCGVDGFDIVRARDQFATVADCGDRVVLQLGEAPELTLHDAPHPNVASRIAWNGSVLAVASWLVETEGPTVRFFDAAGTTLGAVTLSPVEGAPLALDLATAGDHWAVAYQTDVLAETGTRATLRLARFSSCR